MHVLGYIQGLTSGSACLSPGEVSLAASPVPFNPIKLVVLIGWVYLCLYFVQCVDYSMLVPKKCKSIAKVGSLFVGPILFFVLLIIDIFRQIAAESHRGAFEIIAERLRNLLVSRTSSTLVSAERESAIRLLDSSGTELKQIYGHGRSRQEDRHVLRLTEQIVFDALQDQASDILIDPKHESTYIVRFRVDGVLRTVKQLDTNTCQAVINSIKAVSNMDIAEKRRPQDGAFTAETADGMASFRVASAGVVNGEKLSVRVLSQKAGMFTLANIGLSDKQRALIESAIRKPSGMILTCGPTGSGKTTTLYACLNEIDLVTRNVITVEDPIECVLPNASQIEVNPKADITFAKALRSILRQDPDVICVGEIRDEETASIALRASQTGHLVLATLHSYSNESALVRLFDLGVSPTVLASGLDLIISQRLVRLLCKNCKKPARLTDNQMHGLRRKHVDKKKIFQAHGCEKCRGTGYRGRRAIFDFLLIDDELKARIASGQLSVNRLRGTGDTKGKSNLRKQGIKLVLSGTANLDEIRRVVG